MLMHANNRRIDHLHGGVVSAAQRAHDPAPDASPSPTDEAIIASGIWAELLRQVAPWRPRSQDPEDAIKDATVIHTRHAARLVWQHRFNGSPFLVGEFVAHDSGPPIRRLESRLGGWAQHVRPRGALVAMPTKRTSYAHSFFVRDQKLPSA